MNKAGIFTIVSFTATFVRKRDVAFCKRPGRIGEYKKSIGLYHPSYYTHKSNHRIISEKCIPAGNEEFSVARSLSNMIEK